MSTKRTWQAGLALGSLAACATTPAPKEAGSTDSASVDTAAPFVCPETSTPPDLPTDTWTAAGIAPGGDISFLSRAPSDSTRLYAGSTDNGMYRSDDSGQTWTDLPVTISHTMGPIAIHAEEPDILAISTGRLWLSTDAGNHWTEAPGIGGLNPEEEVHGVSWEGDTLWTINGFSEVFRSDDRGATWSRLPEVTPIVPDPPHVAAMDNRWWDIDAVDGRLFATLHTGDLWVSDDRAASWTRIFEGGDVGLVFGTTKVRDNHIWTASHGFVAHSDDSGATFTVLPLPSPFMVGAATLTADGEYWVGGIYGTLQVNADGSTTPVNVPSTYELRALEAYEDMVFVGHHEGIAKSTDNTTSWQDVNEGLVDLDLATLFAHPDCPGIVWAGTQCERGLFKSTDWGQSWVHETTYMHYTMVVAANPSRPEEVWISTDDHILFTRDLGNLWLEGVPEELRYHFHGLGIDPNAPDTVLIGSVGSGAYADTAAHVYRTDDGGQTWADSSTGLPAFDGSVHVLHFSPTAPGVVWLGTYTGDDISHTGPSRGIGLFRSQDHGQTWVFTDTGAQNVSQMESCDGRTYAATDAGLLATDDEGDTWTAIWTAPDEVLTVACFGPKVVAWSGNGDLVYSPDAGATWQSWQEGLPSVVNPGLSRLYDLQFSGDGGLVTFAFRYQGVYYRPAPE